MANLIGKTAAETRANILTDAAAKGLQLLEDRQYDATLEKALNTTTGLAWLMSLSNGTKTVHISIMRDGTISREII